MRRSADNETSRVARPAGALPSNTLSGLSNDRSVSAHAQRDNNRGKSRCKRPQGRRPERQHYTRTQHVMRVGSKEWTLTKHAGRPPTPRRRARRPQHHCPTATKALQAVLQLAKIRRPAGAEAAEQSVWIPVTTTWQPRQVLGERFERKGQFDLPLPREAHTGHLQPQRKTRATSRPGQSAWSATAPVDLRDSSRPRHA